MKPTPVLAVLVLLGCSGGGDTSTGLPPSQNPGPSAPAQQTAQVEMRGADDGYGSTTYSFAPTSVSIARGGTVTWNNSSGVLHNVTFAPTTGAPADISGFSSGSNSRTFTSSGSFSYSCSLHQAMAGTVNVAQ